jgi:small subunit ribosomal protein S17e
MGRIKTVLVKRITKQLVLEHPKEFSEDYKKNKEILDKYAMIKSPKIRNVIAGYASRLVKQSKSGKVRKVINPEDISKYY